MDWLYRPYTVLGADSSSNGCVLLVSYVYLVLAIEGAGGDGDARSSGNVLIPHHPTSRVNPPGRASAVVTRVSKAFFIESLFSGSSSDG